MRFSSKSDVWAYGVLMWEVFTCGKMPYGRMKNTEVVNMVQSGKLLEQPRYCPDDIYNVSSFQGMLAAATIQTETPPTLSSLMYKV